MGFFRLEPRVLSCCTLPAPVVHDGASHTAWCTREDGVYHGGWEDGVYHGG